MKIPLFDIDGTLLVGGRGNQAHRDGFDYAFRTVFGLAQASINEIKTDGMVDQQIILEIVKRHGVNEEQAMSKLSEAVAAIVTYYQNHTADSRCEAAAGAEELLKKLQTHQTPLGLLTGNIEAIAWDKLTRAGLADYFQFGAFGDLALQRVDLIAIACRRANQELGTNYQVNDLVIIGDSPRDIDCAKAGGIPVIGVGAANFSAEQLRQAGADLVVESLEEQDKIIAFLKA